MHRGLNIPTSAHLLCLQNPHGPKGDGRAEKRPSYHRRAEICRPVRLLSSCSSRTIANMQLHSRFLNIRLDKIEVFDEARHPHMVWLVDIRKHGINRCYKDGSEELLYPGVCCAVRPAACGACRHAATGGRYQARCVSVISCVANS